MAAATISVDILVFFVMCVVIGLESFFMIAFPVAERRYWMGTLGRAEYRNKNGIIGIIKSPEGFVGIEKLKFRWPGLLESLAAVPRFGKYFFAGEAAVMKPVGAARVAVIDARSAVSAPPEVISLVEAVRKDYQPASGQIDEKLDWLATSRDAEDAKKKGLPVPPLKRRHFWSRGGDLQAVPAVKSFDEIALHWAEARYYPTIEYARKVEPMDPEKRVAMERTDPAKFAVWKQTYIEDQVHALLFDAQKENEMSIMAEIKTGVLRKTRILESYSMGVDGLTVVPAFTTVQETKPMDKVTRLKWFTGVTREWAKDPEGWTAEIGGKVVDVSTLADFKLSMFGQGQVDDLLQAERTINEDEQSHRNTRLFVYAVCAAIVIVAIAFAGYLLTH